ncbi:hypothetical protein OCUBac02_37780 [Bosea sp. ANAM02]|nr:hypothetical protein OCUBac02_37780 [Bosea sp. ANAM02]
MGDDRRAPVLHDDDIEAVGQPEGFDRLRRVAPVRMDVHLLPSPRSKKGGRDAPALHDNLVGHPRFGKGRSSLAITLPRRPTSY